MHPKRAQRILAQWVIAALPLSALQGCPLIGGGCPPPTSSRATLLGDGGLGDGGLTDAGCEEVCRRLMPSADSVTLCRFSESGGQPLASCEYAQSCVAGRRPEGLLPAPQAAGDPLADFLARQAHLEAASVPAFLRLASELLLHGAPLPQVKAALRAAEEEQQHADLMTKAACRYGAQPALVQVSPPRRRTLVEIAIENAVEGCVRETLGAMVALWQAHTAADPWLRRVMMTIAEDELAHAELAWDVDAWACSRLSRDEKERVDSARDAAFEQLDRELSAPIPDVLRHQLGLPDAARARELLSRARRPIAA